MRINEESIPAWVLTVISPDKLYQELNKEYVTREITIEYHNNKYRLMFERNEENVWNLKMIMKRNPQGFWYRIDK